jgi:hypothetical protein
MAVSPASGGNFQATLDSMAASFDESTKKMAQITQMVNEKKPIQDAAKAFRTNG